MVKALINVAVTCLLGLVLMILMAIFIISFIGQANAECTKPIDVFTIIDISNGQELTEVCETSSKVEADKELQQTKVVNCFVSLDSGEKIYRVFCPISKTKE